MKTSTPTGSVKPESALLKLPVESINVPCKDQDVTQTMMNDVRDARIKMQLGAYETQSQRKTYRKTKDEPNENDMSEKHLEEERQLGKLKQDFRARELLDVPAMESKECLKISNKRSKSSGNAGSVLQKKKKQSLRCSC